MNTRCSIRDAQQQLDGSSRTCVLCSHAPVRAGKVILPCDVPTKEFALDHVLPPQNALLDSAAHSRAALEVVGYVVPPMPAAVQPLAKPTNW